MDFVIYVLIFAGIGLLAGILLTVAGKFLEVKEDETVVALNEALPQMNCGACGFSGCSGYANALKNGDVATNLCVPGGDATSRKISEILGVDFADVVEMVAFVRCNGICAATEDKYNYKGEHTCLAVGSFYNGKGKCPNSCCGYGDCAAVCANGAISIVNGVAVVDPKKCLGCGLCVKACPNHIIELKPMVKTVSVKCSSTDTGKVTNATCKNGCIGCKLCEKVCESGAIKVENNHASIDYDKCTNCGACIEKCPKKCITDIRYDIICK